jgi:hypothetical protein
MFDNKWYFFDPNMEPDISEHDRLESTWNCCADNLKKFYDTTRFDMDWAFGKNFKVTFGEINAVPAPNAAIFQRTTGYLSKTLWIFPLVIVFYKRRKISNRSKYFTPNY